MPFPEPPAEPKVDERRGKRRPLSRRRKWLFRLLAVVLALLPFVLFEGALRVSGVGHETRLVVRDAEAVDPTVYRFNPAADRAYYGVQDLWGPDPRPFKIPKPAGTYRVVTVGGSTVAGFPYPFELTMPRLLELILRRQMPEREIEVLNAGMTSINSFSEVDVVRQIVECQPDLIIVHSGHNEFYGPGGSASNFGGLTPHMYPVTQFLKRQRSFQLFYLLANKPQKKHLIENLPADIGIPLNGPVFQQTLRRFESNLRRMVAIAGQAQIPILLSTVPSNLRDLAPLQPSENEGVLRELSEADRLMSYREYEPALAVLAKARGTDPADPLLAYREAQCLERLGRMQAAAERYTLARDLDGCRFRAATSFLAVVKNVADDASPRVYFCDVDGELRSRTQLPALGNDFFLEHVHYNLPGHWEVASVLGESIMRDVLGVTWRPNRHPDQASRDELLGVTMLDYLAADSLTMIAYDAWPFNLSSARKPEADDLRARMAARYQAVEPDERTLFSGLNMEAMHQHLWLAMGDAWLAAGNADRSLAAFQRHIDRRPWEAAGYLGAARALQAQGNRDAADEMQDRARDARQGKLADSQATLE